MVPLDKEREGKSVLRGWRLAGSEPYTWLVFWADVRSGVAMLAIGLPVGMAFGIASGMGALAGLYCIVIVGFFAAVFGGTKAQSPGPNAAIAVMVSVIIAAGGASLAELAVIVVMAGAFQVLFGLLRVGRFVSYMPHIVLSGFISGVGVILIVSQVQTALGTDIPARGAVGAIAALPAALAEVEPGTAVLSAVTMAILLFWPRALDKWAPTPVIALVAATALGAFWLDGVAVIGAMPTGLPVPSLTVPSLDFFPSAVEPALLIALVGSIYSLMMSLMADAITGAQHNPNRELVGQGVGNLAAGIFGAMPGAANPATLINLQLGGRTVMASIVRALCLVALLLGLGRYAEPIPLAALSVILLKVGWELIDWRFLRSIRRMPRGYAVVMALTFALTVFAGPLTAIAFGLVAAGIAHASRLERMELDSVVSVPLLDRTFLAASGDEAEADPFEARVGLLAFRGAFTVASSRKLVRMVGADIRGHEVVIFDFSDVTHIDDSAAHVMALLFERAGKEKTEVIVMGVAGELRNILDAFGVLRGVPEDRIVRERDEARALARRLLAPVPGEQGSPK